MGDFKGMEKSIIIKREGVEAMLTMEIVFFHRKVILTCDGKCDKAWGVDSRPEVQLSEDIDDFEWLSDGELGSAPLDPGTEEGWDKKPVTEVDKLNRWCARQCERSRITKPGEVVILRDFSKRFQNIKNREKG